MCIRDRFKTGYIPQEFKTAKVIPIFKSGERDDYNNYRPISLLSSFSKVFEKIVAKQVMTFINHRDILYFYIFLTKFTKPLIKLRQNLRLGFSLT